MSALFGVERSLSSVICFLCLKLIKPTKHIFLNIGLKVKHNKKIASVERELKEANEAFDVLKKIDVYEILLLQKVICMIFEGASDRIRT